MKCPHCGKDFPFHKKEWKPTKLQKQILEYCKTNTRYAHQITEHILGNPYGIGGVRIRKNIKTLVERGLLFQCKPDLDALMSMEEGRSRKRIYYTSKKTIK